MKKQKKAKDEEKKAQKQKKLEEKKAKKAEKKNDLVFELSNGNIEKIRSRGYQHLK